MILLVWFLAWVIPVAAGGGGGLLVIIIIVAVCCCCRKSPSENAALKYQPEMVIKFISRILQFDISLLHTVLIMTIKTDAIPGQGWIKGSQQTPAVIPPLQEWNTTTKGYGVYGARQHRVGTAVRAFHGTGTLYISNIWPPVLQMLVYNRNVNILPNEILLKIPHLVCCRGYSHTYDLPSSSVRQVQKTGLQHQMSTDSHVYMELEPDPGVTVQSGYIVSSKHARHQLT